MKKCRAPCLRRCSPTHNIVHTGRVDASNTPNKAVLRRAGFAQLAHITDCTTSCRPELSVGSTHDGPRFRAFGDHAGHLSIKMPGTLEARGRGGRGGGPNQTAGIARAHPPPATSRSAKCTTAFAPPHLHRNSECLGLPPRPQQRVCVQQLQVRKRLDRGGLTALEPLRAAHRKRVRRRALHDRVGRVDHD